MEKAKPTLQAYTPGLEINDKTILRRTRELPILGKTEVKIGDIVKSNQTVLSALLPGEVEIIRLADRLGLEPEDLKGNLLVKEDDKIEKGALICSVKSFFGLFKSEFFSPTKGTVEFFTETNAHLGIRKDSKPLLINSYISGEIVEIEAKKSVTIETKACFMQGIFGVGGERQGEILFLEKDSSKKIEINDLKGRDLNNKIIVAGSSFSLDALNFAGNSGASGIITGSIDADTLRDYVGYEIGVSITGDEEVPATLIITEGFGDLAISERILSLAKRHQGNLASINGATQVRAGAMRPEMIIPLDNEKSYYDFSPQSNSSLNINSRVRLIRVPYFGKLATVEELPHSPEQIESGAKVRVLKAKLDDNGEVVTVPRANVELV